MNTIIIEKKPPKKSVWQWYRRRLRFEIFRRAGWRCQFCGRTIADGIFLTVDHITPKSKGGDFSEKNLLCACYECNQGKADDVLNGWELRDLKSLWEAMRPQPSIIIV